MPSYLQVVTQGLVLKKYTPCLCEAEMGECDVDTDQSNQPAVATLFVIVNGLAILENAGYGLDQRNKLDELMAEEFDVGDLEEKVGLGLLGQAAPIEILNTYDTRKEVISGIQDVTLDVVEIQRGSRG